MEARLTIFLKGCFFGFKQTFQCVQKQGFAELPGKGKEIIDPLFSQGECLLCFIDIQ